MSAERRNATVVITLVVSMTCGTATLLWLEQALSVRPNWVGDALLVMQPGLERQVVISFEPWMDPGLPPLARRDQPGSVCILLPDGSYQSRVDEQSPEVRVIVVGSMDETGSRPPADDLSNEQKLRLLEVLGSLTNTGRARYEVTLSNDLQNTDQRELAPQASDLKDFLEKKQFITTR